MLPAPGRILPFQAETHQQRAGGPTRDDSHLRKDQNEKVKGGVTSKFGGRATLCAPHLLGFVEAMLVAVGEVEGGELFAEVLLRAGDGVQGGI